MSKGNPIVSGRIGVALATEMEEAIFRYNSSQADKEEMTVAKFLAKAIREKLDHMARSRKWPRPKKITIHPYRAGRNVPLITVDTTADEVVRKLTEGEPL
jgi:hypothetical protein